MNKIKIIVNSYLISIFSQHILTLQHIIQQLRIQILKFLIYKKNYFIILDSD